MQEILNPTISKGVHVMADIMSNLKKLTFSNHDLRKFPKLHMSKYMMLVKLMEFGTLWLLPMDWDHGLEKYGILSILYMPRFFLTTKVNTCIN